MRWIEQLRFDANGLIPAVIQDAESGQVLMVAYMNREAVQRTVQTGLCTYWSRSRQQFWVKGETSGHYQRVKQIRVDCDADCLLILVEQVGVACHTGHRSCFYRAVDGDELVDQASL
ncbi:MAG: phosphoribosyl-AMP cyclohydrolase [Armatimonadota bacterium]